MSVPPNVHVRSSKLAHGLLSHPPGQASRRSQAQLGLKELTPEGNLTAEKIYTSSRLFGRSSRLRFGCTWLHLASPALRGRCVGKSFRKGSAFDNPGAPSWNHLNDMREDAQALDAASRAFILLTAASTGSDLDGSQIAFQSIHEGLLRRVNDGPSASSCTGWKRACPKCKSGRVGDHHHVFCEDGICSNSKRSACYSRCCAMG